MFLIAKLALLTSAFFVSTTVLIEALLLAMVYWKGGIFYFFHFWRWASMFFILWFLSFSLAWRIVIFPLAHRSFK